MLQLQDIEYIPWDSAVFGIECYEVKKLSDNVLQTIKHHPGHYTIRVDPLSSKESLQKNGFYYCDTLLEPYCDRDNFVGFFDKNADISKTIPIEQILEICSSAFSHDRFHRDFNIRQDLADQRYNNWLIQLYEEHRVYGLLFSGQLVGFIAINHNKLVLHAIAQKKRGQGLAKYLWSPVCQEIFNQGYEEVISSISATNSPVMNLYSRLGFRFRHAVDIYHIINR